MVPISYSSLCDAQPKLISDAKCSLYSADGIPTNPWDIRAPPPTIRLSQSRFNSIIGSRTAASNSHTNIFHLSMHTPRRPLTLPYHPILLASLITSYFFTGRSSLASGSMNSLTHLLAAWSWKVSRGTSDDGCNQPWMPSYFGTWGMSIIGRDKDKYNTREYMYIRHHVGARLDLQNWLLNNFDSGFKRLISDVALPSLWMHTV